MPPHAGLVHLKEYDIKDSNVELVGSDIDHRVKFNSAATEPAWNDGKVGQVAGLFVWRIENFEVVPWPKERYGDFYSGDSYIVLHSYQVGGKNGEEEKKKLVHAIFFWLGGKTSQDEAGTAAYKTVELDEFLHGVATQHRELQQQQSPEFVALFPRIKILSGGVQSGFRHVDVDEKPQEILTLLRVFKNPAAPRADSIIIHEVEPSWRSLDDNDVFVLDKGDKLWVWQGKNCSPMEKAKAAQVVHDMTLAKHVDVEVLSQTEPRSSVVIAFLGGDVAATPASFHAPRPVASVASTARETGQRPSKLFRLSDASGQLSLDLVKEKQPITMSDLDSNDVFLLDAPGAIWIWEGSASSRAERAYWLKVAQWYLGQLQNTSENTQEAFKPLSKVVQGNEGRAFLKTLEV
jgi:gelsolin